MSALRTSLSDSHHRRISYLRVSLTDRCNFRCGYCYDSGKSAGHRKPSLDNSAIKRLIRIFASMGVRKIRFTGGEPLLRAGIIRIVEETARLEGIETVGITTNGFGMNNMMTPLIDAGLNRINISLDTLNRERFRQITGVDGFERVLAAIDEAEQSGAFEFVKINTVIMRGINDTEIPSLVGWALPRRIDLRFIEYMPVDGAGKHAALFMSEEEIKSSMEISLQSTIFHDQYRGPSESFCHDNYPGRISFISAVSRCFCDGCNRLRLTSRGELLGCLFQNENIDLAAFLEQGFSDDEIAEMIVQAVNTPEFRRTPGEVSVADTRPFMRGIGG